ncbi:MAG TPA: hypothetical protein VF723_04345 [Pyrinomonadaceae bacterium]|jgi:hypothetical protein
MPTTVSDETLAQQSHFIFKGTVQKLRASTVPGITLDDRTVIVRVDEIVQAPEPLADYAGREVTVALGGRKKVKVGEQAIFYTNGWIFGESIAVRSIDQRAAPRGVAAMGITPGDPVENLANKESRLRFESADVVVSGRVTSVRLSSQEVAAGGAMAAVGAAGETTLARPISEHDPLIQEAVVEVDAVHKGTHASNEVTVSFPSSTDVKWYKAPKFRPGQQGFFMLQKDETRETHGAKGAVISAMVSAEESGGGLTALHPADFQPLDRPGGVRNLISSLPGATPPQDED